MTWGPENIAAFCQNSARLAYLLLALVAQVLIVILIPNSGLGKRAGPSAVARQKTTVFILQALTLAIVGLAPCTDRRNWSVIPG